MNEIIRAPRAADFLAALPSIVGYTAPNSLMCIPFHSNRTHGAFRLDLPIARRTADYRAVASAVVGMLGRMPDVDGVIPVIYTDATFADERGIPWLDFSRELAKRLRDAGYRTPDELCVAADGWASYFERDYPRDGHPLEEIATSEVGALALEARGSDARDISEHSTLPEPDAGYVKDLDYVRSVLEAGDTEECDAVLNGLEQYGELEPIDWVETCLQLGELPADVACWLLYLIQSPANRDVMMLQFAFGRDVGVATVAENEHYLAIQRSRGGSMDDVVRDEIEAGRSSLDELSSELITGASPTRPDVDRTESAIRILRHLCAHSAEEFRPPVFCMLAWLSWALGRGTAAGVFVGSALAIDPDYGMAQVIEAVLAYRGFPNWAFAQPALA